MRSDQINELAAALAKAQGNSDRFSEARIIPQILNIIKPMGEQRGGNYRKHKRQNRFLDRISFGLSDCWYWKGRIDKDGYPTLANERAHRLSYQYFNGDIKPGLVVMHSCDVASCVNPNHLTVGTQAQNIADRDRRGRTHSGRRKNDFRFLIATCLDTGQEIYFDGFPDAELNGFQGPNIHKCLYGKRKSHKNFTWRVENEKS